MRWLAGSSLLTKLLVIGGCLALSLRPAVSQELRDPEAEKRDSNPAGAGGMTIHIDPQTGRLTTKPAGALPIQLSPAEANAFSTSHQGLVETLSPRPGGGTIIDLQGRFQSPLVGTIDAEGKIMIRHLDAWPGAGEAK